jgi:hypothetical protein
MHRSGTSALTRVLGLLGADLPLNLLGANDGNEAGHWESVDLIAIHDNLLSSAGSTWDDWRAFNPDWTASPVADAYKQQIAEAVERNWPASPLFVVKDPRICRFVPVWLDVLDRIGVEPRIVIPVRNPLEVAASLKRRNGFLPAKSYLLWLRHVLDADLNTRDLPRAFTTYDHLLTDWRSAVTQVAQRAGICWPRHSDFAELEIDKFLATTLRHHSFDAASLDARSEIVDWVKEAHDIINRMASGDQNRNHLTRLDQIRAEFEKASRVFGLVLAESEEKTAMVAQVHATESKQTHAQLAELEQEVARLREDARHEVTILRTEAEREVAQLRDEAEREATKLRDEAELARVFAAEQERLATERFIAIEEAGRREALLIRKIETTQTDLLAAVAERNEAQSQLEQSRREAATLRSGRDGARAGMREAQSQLQSLAGDLDAAQTALTQERKSRERALADVTRLAATADRLNAVEASLRFEKALARRQADELARLRSALAEAVDAAQEQQHAAQMMLTEERAARELAQADVARLAATVDQLAASEASLKYERSLSGQQKHEIARLQSALAEAETGAAARDAKSAAEAECAAAETRTLYAQTKELRETVVQQAVVIEDKAARRRRVFPVWRSMRQRLSRWRRPDFEARAWEVEPIRRSKLFSALWYLEHNPDVVASGDDPLLHYLVHGGVDRRNPHPLFDARWYVAQYPQVAEAKMTPLTHYVTVGVSEGLDPMPLFDTDFYLRQNPDMAASGENPLYHYMTRGAYVGCDPNPLFDSSWYLEKNPDIAAAKDNPLLHYILHGWKEGRDPHPNFDAKWYLTQNPDVAAAGQNPLEHYVLHGEAEGRSIRSCNPSPASFLSPPPPKSSVVSNNEPTTQIRTSRWQVKI